MFFILLLGIILRLTFIDKAEGLWNDEYVSWMISAIPFGQGFFDGIMHQCHMPLYYLYLKPLANSSDLVLRLTSLVPNILCIWVMYLAGKIYSNRAGIYAGLITSVLSFLVYYSQEVRFYSLLSLFSACLLLFTLKYLKNFSIKNLCFVILFSLLVVFTHVLGIIFVFFNSIFILYSKKKINLKIITAFIILLLCLLPFGINVLKMLPQSQWWGYFSYTNILFLFSDFFSPILSNNINAPSVFFYNKDIVFMLLIPTIIALYGLISGVVKNKEFRALIGVAICTVFIMCILAYFKLIVFVTKYSIEVLPIFIFIISISFAKMRKWGIYFITTFVMFHILSFFTPYYVTKIPRSEGHKIVGEIINSRKPEYVLFTYYDSDRFLRYTDFDKKKTYSISKVNRFKYKDNPENILKFLKTGDKLSVVFLDSVSFFSDNDIRLVRSYAPEMFVTFSEIKNSLIRYMNDHFKNFQVDTKGSWTVITAVMK